MDFLAIESKLLSDKSYEIILNFAGDKLIKVNSEVIDCFLDDQGEPWKQKINQNMTYLMNKILNTKNKNFINQLSYYLDFKKKNSVYKHISC